MNHDYDFLVVLKEKIGCDKNIVIELASQLSKTQFCEQISESNVIKSLENLEKQRK